MSLLRLIFSLRRDQSNGWKRKEHPILEDTTYYELEAELPTTKKGSLFLVFLTYSEVLIGDNALTEFAIRHFQSKLKQAIYLKWGLKRLEVVLGTYEDDAGHTQLSGYVLNARDLQFDFFRYLDISGHPQLEQHTEAQRYVVGMSFSLFINSYLLIHIAKRTSSSWKRIFT